MVKDRDVRNALETLASEIEAQEAQIDYLSRELDQVHKENIDLNDLIESFKEENSILKGKIDALEQALTEAYLTSKE